MPAFAAPTQHVPCPCGTLQLVVARATPPGAQLERRLGLWSCIGIVIGVTIGSGIFRTPAVIASRAPDPRWMLAAWLIGGLMSLCGALSVAELAGALPETGGWYVFLREAWGRPVAFLFGWSELVLIRASAIGAIALVFAEYLLRSLGCDAGSTATLTHVVAAVAIVMVGLLNIAGVQIGAALASMSSVAKFGGLLLLVGLSAILGRHAGATSAHLTAAAGEVRPGTFGLALISVLWAYDGFADVSFAAGEVREPQRTLPRAIVLGTLAIVCIYLLANVAYLYDLPIGRVAASPLVAADTMQAVAGRGGVAFISVVVALSTFGALTVTLLAPPRVFFAMADDRLFFDAVARVHPRYRTPYVAIGIAMALGAMFVLTRTFEQLADTFVLSIWPFYGIAIAGLYRLRRTRPDLQRVYRVPGYPLTPAIFIVAVAYLVADALATNPWWTAATFGVVLAGLPVYRVAFARTAGR